MNKHFGLAIAFALTLSVAACFPFKSHKDVAPKAPAGTAQSVDAKVEALDARVSKLEARNARVDRRIRARRATEKSGTPTPVPVPRRHFFPAFQ